MGGKGFFLFYFPFFLFISNLKCTHKFYEYVSKSPIKQNKICSSMMQQSWHSLEIYFVKVNTYI